MSTSIEQAAAKLPLEFAWRGKVREVYHVDAERVLMVTSDRISAFDVVLDDPIPYKGIVLTQLSAWWFRQLDGRIANHLISADTDEIISLLPALAPHRPVLQGRAMLCRRAKVFPVECVIRGYLAGSAWKEYSASGTLAGEPLRPGLIESDRLDPPIFSPATKATEGHDENITIERMRTIVGTEAASALERLTREVYEFGRGLAADRGIIIGDTKFEFGTIDDEIVLVDEVLTPDSSRFWPAEQYEPGRGQASFDKQPLRDYLDGLRRAGSWDGDAPAPRLSPDIIAVTSERYLESYRRLTGEPLPLAAAG